MGSSSNKELAENKLILLYVLHEIKLPINNQQLTKFILENKLMNYFNLQEYLNELCDSDLIGTSDVENKKCYLISNKGLKMLQYFANHIPKTITAQIDNNLANMKNRVKNDLFITTNFSEKGKSEYLVECKIKENNFDLINLKLHVGNKSNVNNICNNWKSNAETIYNEIIEVITKKR